MNDLVQELIKEAVSGRIIINDCYYNIGFDTVINNQRTSNGYNKDLLFPTLIINNYDEFLYKMTLYLEKAKKFYYDELVTKYSDYSERDISKLLISLIWSNATSVDFSNPLEFLDRRISFLDSENYSNYSGVIEDISIFDNTIMEYSVNKSTLKSEAPYCLKVSLSNKGYEEDIYNLPDIYFGVDNNKVYIYAIQDKHRKSNSDKTKFNKMIRRNLNKVKKGFVSDISLDSMNLSDVEKFNIDYPENMISVDASTLVSLSVGLAIFEEMGINEIVVPDFFPIRDNSSIISTNLKLKREHNNIDFIEEELAKRKRERINRNIVDKKIRTFRRISNNFNNLDIYAFPKEIDDNIHIRINEDYYCDNEVLNEVYIKTFDNCKKNTNKK